MSVFKIYPFSFNCIAGGKCPLKLVKNLYIFKPFSMELKPFILLTGGNIKRGILR